jgi:hypothetical protein
MASITFVNLPYQHPQLYSEAVVAHLKHLGQFRRLRIDALDVNTEEKTEIYLARIKQSSSLGSDTQIGYVSQEPGREGDAGPSVTVGVSSNAITQSDLERLVDEVRKKNSPSQ